MLSAKQIASKENSYTSNPASKKWKLSQPQQFHSSLDTCSALQQQFNNNHNNRDMKYKRRNITSVENDAETSRERRNHPTKKKARSSLLTQLGQKNKALF